MATGEPDPWDEVNPFKGLCEEYYIQGPEPQQDLSSQIFHCFHRLPTELRLRIWSLALPKPQLVLCFFDNWLIKRNFRDCTVRQHDIMPLEYTACREMWHVFKENYRYLDVRQINSNSTWPIGWIDSKQDTLMTSVVNLQILEAKGYFLDCSHVEIIALANEEFLHMDLSSESILRAMFPRLKTFISILGVDEYADWSAFYRYSQMRLFNLKTPLNEIEVIHHSHRRPYPSFSKNPKLLEFLDQSSAAQEIHQERISKNETSRDPETWINYEVAILMGTELRERCERVNLAPCIPQSPDTTLGVIYYTITSSFSPSHVDFPALDVQVECLEDGSFGSRYDGIAGLFSEAGDDAEDGE
jgi:hypothetical protein